MLNETNPFETNKSTKKFTPEIFPDKHTIEQLNRKNIPSIHNHSIQMFKETLKIKQNLKNNWPNITEGLNTIQDYVNQILKENEQIKQIVKDMPDATNAFENDASFKQITLQKTKQMIELLHKTNTLETDKSTEKFTQKNFPDKHTIQQLNQKHIQSVEDHPIQMFKEFLLLLPLPTAKQNKYLHENQTSPRKPTIYLSVKKKPTRRTNTYCHTKPL